MSVKSIASLAVVGGLGLFGYWALNLPTITAAQAKTECVRFANENLSQRLYEDVRAMETWSKKGYRVVELGYFETKNSKRYTPRICVVGDGRIQIVSMFENWMWRQ
jgi:hypothetical protein